LTDGGKRSGGKRGEKGEEESQEKYNGGKAKKEGVGTGNRVKLGNQKRKSNTKASYD